MKKVTMKVHPLAAESLKRFSSDLKAKHLGAAEYWRGQAGAYFTANPKIKVGDKVLYKGEVWEVGFINQREWKGTLRLQKGPSAYDKQVNRVYPEDIVRLIRGQTSAYFTANPLTKKIGDITWIADYATRSEARKEATRWLRDGFSVKIIASRRKWALYPYSLWVAEGSRRGQTGTHFTANPITYGGREVVIINRYGYYVVSKHRTESNAIRQLRKLDFPAKIARRGKYYLIVQALPLGYQKHAMEYWGGQGK